MPNPSPTQQLEEALDLHRQGRLEAAAALYRQVLEHNPDEIDALHLLGAISAQQGNAEAGLKLIDRAIQLEPTCPDFYNNKGLILAGLGRLEEAVSSHEHAVELDPDFAEAHNNLGNALVKIGQLEKAESAFRKTIQLQPDYANAYSNLGVVLQRQNKFEQAIAAYRDALRLQPNHAEAQSNLGAALRETGRLAEAIDAYRAAIAIDESCIDAHSNLGAAYQELGQPDDAVACYERAIRLDPRAHSPRYNLALTLLQQGDYSRGFAEYEHRTLAVLAAKRFPQPPWDGSDLNGSTILIHAEGGLGDVILFARYLPLVKARGGKTVVLVQPELIDLISTIEGADRVLAKTAAFPPFEFHVPLLSLAHVFHTTSDTIPSKPYIFADPVAVSLWSAKLAGLKRLKVGLTWESSQKLSKGRHRWIPFEQLSPLKQFADISFISLQKEQSTEPAPIIELLDWTADLHNLTDTAALIQSLDLVITVDTAVANLAGAMGKRVFVLLSHAANWRWLRDRPDTPWYPTARLFRQKTPGDWSPVVAELTDALKSEFSPPA